MSQFPLAKRVSFIKGGLLFVFFSLSFLVYLGAMQKKKKAESELKARFEALGQEKQALLEIQEELKLQIQSQNDPEWIQLTLMKEIGVVPEGQVKVYFEKQEEGKETE